MDSHIERILFTAEEVAQRVRELGAEISRDYAGKTPLVVGVLKGAVVFLADLVRVLDIPVEMDFIGAASYRNSTESSREVEVYLCPQVKGRDVLIVEDIVDTGWTLARLRKFLLEQGAASVRVCALLDKPSRRETPVEVEYCGFEIPDCFVVGYGLDYAQRYRNLPFIGVIGKTKE